MKTNKINAGEKTMKIDNLTWNPTKTEISIEDNRVGKGNSDTWTDTDFNTCYVKYEVECYASGSYIETIANIISIDLMYQVENIDTEETEIVEIKIERFEDYAINIEFEVDSDRSKTQEDGIDTNIHFNRISIDTEEEVVTIYARN